MSCERFDRERLLYACGDLAHPPAEWLRHLDACRDCAGEVGAIEEVRELYRSEPAPRPMRLRRGPLAGLASAAAALIVGMTGWFLTQPSREPAPVAAYPAILEDGPSIDGQIALLRARLDALRVADDSF